MKTVKIIKLRGKLVHKNAVRKSGTKSGTAVNFELKIRTVPLKAGQLESMLEFTTTYLEIRALIHYTW